MPQINKMVNKQNKQ